MILVKALFLWSIFAVAFFGAAIIGTTMYPAIPDMPETYAVFGATIVVIFFVSFAPSKRSRQR